MTDLQVRKMRFAFADYPVPFVWNETNAAFSAMANAVSFLAIAFEKMIVSTMAEAKPLLTDPVIAEEADAFVRQEGQHSMAHRAHARGLIKAYPALKETLDEVIASFDDLVVNKPLKYRLAYTADLEATFTPVFKLMLDHDDTLFAPGDDRVASLFLWHFVEEVEHRSSALIIYEGLVNDPWYRMRVAPSIFRHVLKAVRMACNGFNKHLSLEVRKVDALSAFALERRKNEILKRLGRIPDYGPFENAFTGLPVGESLTALSGIVRSQIPGHNPAHEKLPALAAEWFDRYDAGYDVTHWYTAGKQSTNV
ncbi:metal-dependent hydrolase [Mycobacterium sp. OTB74]|uniref:metal-dependent hydrolase n=1 Tax=Mycobacterium sp. OTB74 TaxID=1853452 RepID=UPI002474EEE9|nr:metal-dependent hydrolase [Mycobacterium sp. OTB74]MDH6244491.1 putative metal-dependent hydrolase [Mycobacterium sp. OTB74]